MWRIMRNKNGHSQNGMHSRRTVLKTGVVAATGISGLSTTGAAQQTHTLTVGTIDITNAGGIVADVTVNGETKTTSNGEIPTAKFELENGAYTVSATSDAGYGWSGETEVEINGADEEVTISLAPDYPDLDHVEHGVDLIEQDDGTEAYVASGTIENNTTTPSPEFSAEVILYNSDVEQIGKLESQTGFLGLEVVPGESVDWETIPLDEDDPDFDEVDPTNYDILLRGGAEGLPFSEIEVRGGADDPADGDPDEPGEAPGKKRGKGRKRGKGQERGKGQNRGRGQKRGRGRKRDGR